MSCYKLEKTGCNTETDFIRSPSPHLTRTVFVFVLTEQLFTPSQFPALLPEFYSSAFFKLCRVLHHPRIVLQFSC